MPLLDTNDLAVVHQRIYQGKARVGWTESYHIIPPSGATKNARLRAAAPAVLAHARHRANLFPDDVWMDYIHISFLDQEGDGKQVLGTTLLGLSTGGVPKYNSPNDGSSTLNFRAAGTESNSFSVWVSGVSDDWLRNNGLIVSGGAQNIGIREADNVTLPVPPGNNSHNDVTLIQKFLDSFLKTAVYGRRWKGTGTPTALFQYSPLDDIGFTQVSKRKHGPGWGAPKGRRRVGA